jgi:hypothetical protein
MTLNVSANDPDQPTNISSDVTRKHRHESALMTAAHILITLTQEGKSIEQIAMEDFDNNLELVTVWVDYMVAINWIRTNNNNGKTRWAATQYGKKSVEKAMNSYLYDDI